MQYVLLFLAAVAICSCKSDRTYNISGTEEIEPLSAIGHFDNPAGLGTSLPRLFSRNDSLYMSWVKTGDSISELLYSTYVGGTWSPPVTTARGLNWFVNWADFPTIAANDKAVMTTYLEMSAEGTYTYDAKATLVDKDAKNSVVRENLLLHNDGTKSEHGFVSISPFRNEGFFVSWLDGRNTVGAPPTMHADHAAHDLSTTAMTLRSAFVDNRGDISRPFEIDHRVCDCCGTAMAMTAQGPIVVYRDRGETEIRDIYKSYWENGAWSEPEAVFQDNWQIPGCPVNGPSVSAYNENVAIAWYTASNDDPRVAIAFSDDAGRTMNDPIRLDTQPALGRVDVQMVSEKEALVLWMEENGTEAFVQLQKVTPAGTLGKPLTITKTLPERAAGFPQLDVVGAMAVIAWTSLEEKQSTIRTAKIPLNSL
ncbi:MAG: hypothetical protein CMC08_09250 [Flavobacteriaceae bacterium]|nr:hypothetical protein [Flavobacteriaceae bacterium]